MHVRARVVFALLALFSISGAAFCATFGTSVPIRGTVSDLALDEARGRLYIANFSASRIEVMDTSSRALQSPLLVPLPPSAVTLSSGGSYLVVGEYDNPAPPKRKAG